MTQAISRSEEPGGFADCPRGGRPTHTLRKLVRHYWMPTAVYLASRVVVFVAAYFAGLVGGAKTTTTSALFAWDGVWYLSVAEFGYSHTVPTEGQSNIAFFPLFPLLIKGVQGVTGASFPIAGLVAVHLCGLAAMLVLWDLVRSRLSAEIATRTVALLCFFPASFLLSMGYSEALFLLTSAVCLSALWRERWLLAGVAAALTSATRPNGILLGAACLWVAIVAIRRKRAYLAMFAPVMSGLGLAAYHLYLWHHTGDPRAYTHAQTVGWGYDLDFGRSIVRTFRGAFTNPGADLNQMADAFGLTVMIVALVLLIRMRAPREWVIFCAANIVVAMFILPVHSTPRFTLALFPLIVALAASLRGVAITIAVGVGATLMGAGMVLVTTGFIYTP